MIALRQFVSDVVWIIGRRVHIFADHIWDMADKIDCERAE